MSTHPHQWSTEALQIAEKHGVSADFAEVCLRMCPDIDVVDHICAIAVLVGEQRAYAALCGLAYMQSQALTDSEYAI